MGYAAAHNPIMMEWLKAYRWSSCKVIRCIPRLSSRFYRHGIRPIPSTDSRYEMLLHLFKRILTEGRLFLETASISNNDTQVRDVNQILVTLGLGAISDFAFE
jgi:hypothetical protein